MRANIVGTQHGGACRRFLRNSPPCPPPDEHLRPAAGRVRARRRRLAVGRRRQALSRRARRHRRVRPRPRPPALVQAIAEQAAQLIHTSNLYRIPRRSELADRSGALSGMDKVFFCNSGCEANEAAIKLARLYGHSKGIESPAIIVMEKAFHGRTWRRCRPPAAARCRPASSRCVAGFVRVPFNDLDAVRQVADAQPERRRGAGRADPGRGRHQRPAIRSTCARLRAHLRRSRAGC